ncbi:hypothetical protein [Streptomyces alanosinicus]|uniref:Uncharacterized protein n=1 Tax=Streptomyces alanosinicus TaxID=68171 RepID=A0A918IPD4_9ACTN|nr:hypothetical protein [Streptomyces alanosinicus]GGW25354.1 hypothetical protein GCM10010339_94810 [Streptomyces alanosinicus]
MSHDTPQPPAQGPTPVNCVVCQGEFIPHPRQIYCSPRCKVLARRAAPAEPQTHSCPACGGEFTANPRLRQVYCSPACRRDAEKQRDRQRDEERARRLGETLAPPAMPGLPPPPRTTPRSGSRAAGPERDPLEPTATRNCPHCQQPVTIVALLATPEAARPAMPAGPDVIPLRRTP